MKRSIVSVVILIAAFVSASTLFGHAGEVHTYMGTVAVLHEDASFTLKKTDGVTITVQVSSETVYVYADGAAADRTAVKAGKRVVVTISKDGKTASTVKLAR